MSRWTPDPEALRLLERHGGPFDGEAFRGCWLSAFPGHIDASWGGRLTGGARAAIALVKVGDVAESLPWNYGGIVATRPLHFREVRGFLRAARQAAGCRWIVARSVPLGPPDAVCHHGSRVAGWTSVVRIVKATDVEMTFAYKARRAVRFARDAGARAVVGRDPEAFLRLYGSAARTHIYRYPDDLVRSLAREGVARFHEVELEGARVASVMALLGPSHWTAWLAAQDSRGRDVSANYLAVADLIETAAAAGIPAVNLGISAGMSGVAMFKRRFGAVAFPVMEDRIGTPPARATRWLHGRARSAARRLRRAKRVRRGGRGRRHG